jgi:flavin-dependent dehydrogenase
VSGGASHDVVIVGARCAGASLGTLLARGGASVLVLDRARLPSDVVLSTHTIHPPGIEVLDELGVGAAMRQVTPPTHVLRLAKDGAAVDLRYRGGRAEYCPRRKRLDGLLQDVAREAGCELLDETRVDGLLWDGDRVAGVRVTRGAAQRTYRARLVVGADGRHSTIARLVGAEEYLDYDAPRAMYWGYWDAPPLWHERERYPFGMYVGHRSGDVRAVFQTDDGQLLIGSLPPVDKALGWRGDPLAALVADLSSDPVTGPLVEGRDPDGPVRGTVRERYFFRRATGPGWVLVGDAGHHKEFILGDGITEALLQARSLSERILAGRDTELVRWWRARDVEAVPLHLFGKQEGAPGPPPELQRAVFARVARSPELRDRMAHVMEHEVNPFEALPVPLIVRCALARALRGRLGVIREFVAMGRFAAGAQREWASRKKLLQEVVAS